jgi:riboflavin kinase/FMN adenylyltransferase
VKGFPFTVSGLVVRGAGLGKKLGFPTANLALQAKEIPERGVYKVEVQLDGKPRPAVCNVGLRPTVDGQTGLHVEVHIPGFSGDLYGRTLSVTFLSKLREERKFPDVEALKAQIRADVESLAMS